MSMDDLCIQQLTVDLSRLGELISPFVQEIAHFAAEFPSSKVKCFIDHQRLLWE
jgi:hypothetical protein